MPTSTEVRTDPRELVAEAVVMLRDAMNALSPEGCDAQIRLAQALMEAARLQSALDGFQV